MESRIDNNAQAADAEGTLFARIVDSAIFFMMAASLISSMMDISHPPNIENAVGSGIAIAGMLIAGVLALAGRPIPKGAVWLLIAVCLIGPTISSFFRGEDLAVGALSGTAFLAMVLAGVLSFLRPASKPVAHTSSIN